jgi:tetratricopeptide (TPR) repeat protein
MKPSTTAFAAAACVAFLAACGGHAARTLEMRTALDQGMPRAAIASINKELEVDRDTDLPKDIQGDNALLVLDRASIQQSLAQFQNSLNDFQAADKAIDMLDLAQNAGDQIGKYIFSDSAGKYAAPPYEKLLINTMNMLNYLELHDLNGARIEARRLAVMQKYFSEKLDEKDNAVLGLGGFLAGLTFEKSGDANEALRFYDDALQFSGFQSLREPVRMLLRQGTYSSPRLKGLDSKAPPPQPLEETGEAELVFVLGYGRVPHKVPVRLPIGLVLTRFAWAISPNDSATAGRLAAQGLVTWVNFPSLAPERGSYAIPECQLDGRFVQLEEAVNVSAEVKKEWHKLEGKIVASAITRMISRILAGEAARKIGGGGALGLVLSLGTQATLTALDTPDTRSWETLPARIAIARVRVPPGEHTLMMDSRGVMRRQTIKLDKGEWAVVSLMALR